MDEQNPYRSPDAVVAEMGSGPDARQQQQLR